MLNTKTKKIFLLVIIIFIVILILAISLVNSQKSKSNTTIQYGFKGYDSLKSEISKISSDNLNTAQNPDYQKMIYDIQAIEDSNSSKEDKYKSLRKATNYLIFAYAGTNDHNLYQLQKDLNNFIITNYPNKNRNFKPFCFDPKCAEPPAPEIQNVMSEIKSSGLPDYIKENDLKNLTNFSYLTKDSAQSKAGDFLIVADGIRKNPEYIKLGINEKISGEITAYVQKNFPKEYTTFMQNSTLK